MKVLLLQDVKKVGRKMEVKEVSDGYARNFLIARKMAVPASEGALKVKSAADAEESQLIEDLQSRSNRLKKEILEFKVKTGKDGSVFNSVTKDQIKKALEEKGFGKVAVNLDKSLRFLGERKIEVDFGRGIKSAVLVKLLSQ